MIKKQRGFTLVELLLAVAIILGLTAGFFLTYDLIKKDNMLRQMVKEHISLMRSVHDIAISQNSYFLTGDWATILINAKAVPPNMQNVAGSLRSAIGGKVEFQPMEFQGPSSGGTAPGIGIMQITYSNLNKSNCFKFVAAIAVQSYDTKVNGSRVFLYNKPALDQVDFSQIDNLCQNTDTNIVQVQQTQPLDTVYYAWRETPLPSQTILYPKLAALNAQKQAWHP